MIYLSTTVSIIISWILMILSSSLSKKKIENREKMSPFECGFDPKTSARMPFSIHFFLIAILFIIFDIEITLILPFIKNELTKILNLSTALFLILLIMMMGLLHEWNQGALNWKI
uniref:NADH-ubiquinone oxidoreductase chain 3 n=1 Tax=Elateroidea sp. 5 KM-2017 TaxID=2219428 RepID=A0A346RK42_9COLE|nr:NADH dehydrogenase subunit 3 [Elateroidea sp. 5 KM-2017]